MRTHAVRVYIQRIEYEVTIKRQIGDREDVEVWRASSLDDLLIMSYSPVITSEGTERITEIIVRPIINHDVHD